MILLIITHKLEVLKKLINKQININNNNNNNNNNVSTPKVN
jgi:hypothetical protein